MGNPPYKLFLRLHLSPGDSLVATASVEALKRQFPGQYRVMVQTTAPEIWDNNPHVEQLVEAECFVEEFAYPLINRCGQEPRHFLEGFCEDLGRKLGVNLRLDTNRPSLYLSEAEKSPTGGILDDLPPYIVVNAGFKTDFTAKFASTKIYQEVIEHFATRLVFVQIGEKNPSHIHKPLSGAINMVGKTTTRELIRLAYHSMAGVGPVSFIHHVYGAFQKPYVAMCGGREETSWEQYNTATMLSTLGQLPCCQYKACWKSHTVALPGLPSRSLCELPVVNSVGETLPKCMELLGSDAIIKAIERMLAGGVIQ